MKEVDAELLDEAEKKRNAAKVVPGPATGAAAVAVAKEAATDDAADHKEAASVAEVPAAAAHQTAAATEN